MQRDHCILRTDIKRPVENETKHHTDTRIVSSPLKKKETIILFSTKWKIFGQAPRPFTSLYSYPGKEELAFALSASPLRRNNDTEETDKNNNGCAVTSLIQAHDFLGIEDNDDDGGGVGLVMGTRWRRGTR